MENISGTDDLFADSSTETVKENKCNDEESTTRGQSVQEDLKNGLLSVEENWVSTTSNMTNGSVIAIRVIEEYCKPSQIVYCPFCPMSYTTEQPLKNHLKDCHKPHLNLILSNENPFITLQSCTLCHAQFYTRGLLPLHLLKTHVQALIGLINCRSSKHDEYLYCMYCHYTVLRSNSRALMAHLEKMHFLEFESFIVKNYSVQVNAKEALSSFQDKAKFVHFSTSLNRNNRRVSFSDRGLSSSARRKLDFNEVEIKRARKIKFRIHKKDKITTENNMSVSKIRKNKKRKISQWLPFLKGQEKDKATVKMVTSTPKLNLSVDMDKASEDSSFEFMQFRCASCHQTFRSNTDLLSHVGRCHKWPWNRLRPCYSCGFCDARFYRNSFLVRHTINHHTPKCLRNVMDD